MNVAFIDKIDKLIPLAIIPLCFLVVLAGKLFGGEVALGVVLAIGISNWMYNRFSSRRRSLEGSRKRFYRFLDSLEPSYEPYLGGFGYLPGMGRKNGQEQNWNSKYFPWLEKYRTQYWTYFVKGKRGYTINSGEVVVYFGEECFFCESKFDDVSIHYATNRIKWSPTHVIPGGMEGVDLGAYICNDCRTNIDISKVRRVIRKTREIHESKSDLETPAPAPPGSCWVPSFIYREQIEKDASAPPSM